MTTRNINIIFNINEYGHISNLSSKPDHQVESDEFISLKNAWLAKFSCSSCRTLFSLRLCYRFTYKPDINDTVLKFEQESEENSTAAAGRNLKVAAIRNQPSLIEEIKEEKPMPEASSPDCGHENTNVVEKDTSIAKVDNSLPKVWGKLRVLTKEEAAKYKHLIRNGRAPVKKLTKLEELPEIEELVQPTVQRTPIDLAVAQKSDKEEQGQSKFKILEKVSSVIETLEPAVDLELSAQKKRLIAEQFLEDLEVEIVEEMETNGVEYNIEDSDNDVINSDESDVDSEIEMSDYEYFENDPAWWCPIYASNVGETLKYRYECHICGLKFQDPQNHRSKIDHVDKDHPYERIKLCEVCGKNAPIKRQCFYSDHRAKHFPDQSKLSCSQCPKTFSRSYALNDHIKYKHEGVPKQPKVSKFQCDICGRKCFSRQGIVLHMKRMHIKFSRVFACVACPYKAVEKRLLDKHVKSVHAPENEKQYECTTCGKRFALNCTLRIHMLVHSGVREFKCEICEKAYKQSCDLKNHMYIHTGELPYECRFCGKKFRDRGHKNHHQRQVHPKELDEYKCFNKYE